MLSGYRSVFLFFFFPTIKQMHHDKYEGNEGEGEKIIICIQKWELKRSRDSKIQGTVTI